MYVPVSEPSGACVNVIDMFVIPAAGPGDVHVPVMSVLDGVVSEGPHEASASARAAKRSFERNVIS